MRLKMNTSNLMNTVLCQPDNSWVIFDNKGHVYKKGTDINKYCSLLFKNYSCHKDKVGETNQFYEGRFAIALLQGTYDLDINVGYYTSILGMGQHPEDVTINGKVQVPNSCKGHALDNFWRSCEGVQINVSGDGHNYWRVSQAAPFRRNIINGSLALGQSTTHETGYSSGGYLGECVVNKVNGTLGDIDFGTQQQFFVGTSRFENIKGGSWNFVFAGTVSNPIYNQQIVQGKKLNTQTGPIDRIAGKPYLIANSLTDFELAIPKIMSNVEGELSYTDEFITKTKNFTIIDPTVSVREVNALLSEGTSIVFSPGIYHYPEPIIVSQSYTTLLGLGFATIIPTYGTEAIVVYGKGCRVAGIMVQAGTKPTHTKRSSSLIRIGSSIDRSEGDRENPTILQDVFCRVGGPDLNGECDTMLLVNQDYTILENTWNWRADHTDYIRDGLGVDKAKVDHCVVVNGNDVTAYCLMIEHTLKELCVWNGDRGRIFFIQSELAYDVGDYDTPWDYPGLRINGADFFGTNLGFYSFFANKHKATTTYPKVSSAIVVQPDSEINSAMSLLLDPNSGGGIISNVINNMGQQSDLSNPGIPSWCAHGKVDCMVCNERL